MKIVVLDGYTENPGDLSWEGLERLGAVEVYDRTPVGDVEEILRRMVTEGCPRLRFIEMLSTGYDVVDCAAARAFGMEVMACDTHPSGTGRALAQYVSLDDLLARSDVVVLHCPLSAETAGLIRAENIAKMKEGAILINNSRGGLVVEADLARALAEGKLSAAGLDVVSSEPIRPDNPLLTAPPYYTPHQLGVQGEPPAVDGHGGGQPGPISARGRGQRGKLKNGAKRTGRSFERPVLLTFSGGHKKASEVNSLNSACFTLSRFCFKTAKIEKSETTISAVMEVRFL